MKVDPAFVFHFLCIFLYCWSSFSINGVYSDSKDSLDIKPTNESIVADQKLMNEEVTAQNVETVSEIVIESVPVDLLQQIPENVVAEVTAEHGGVTSEIINNDTPIVPPISNAAEELQKRANILSPLSEDNPSPNDSINETRSDNNTKSLETEEKPKNTTEDIPSFSEWAQKHLEEAEKKEQVNFSTSVNQTKQAKLRWKNYASVDCGSKVIQANAEAQNLWAILVGSRDAYALNPCNSKIWFVIELCEPIQLKKIDLANYELFSSSPKDFTLSVSDRYPTRDWSVVGQFAAKDERDVQNFDINTESFGKYVKVEIKSHYGAEHYCPLSLFRAYGMSVFEALQKDDPAHEQSIDDDDDDDDVVVDKNKDAGNILSTATDAVISMVKKAAQVLGNKHSNSGTTNVSSAPIIKSCSSPSHYVVCNNCSDDLFGKIFELLSCRHKYINNLVNIPFINKVLLNSPICLDFGYDFRDKTSNYPSEPVKSFFANHILGAMCNWMAITHNKVLYNVSYQFSNASDLSDSADLVNIDVAAPKVAPPESESTKVPEVPTIEDQELASSKSSCSTDVNAAPQKTIVTELPVLPEFVEAENVDKVADLPVVEPVEDIEVVDESVEGEAVTDPSVSVVNAPQAASNMQKESVFLRLSNRIKALERNMSLSGQYLEELSKRYKKQVEEMQRVLEKTEQSLHEVTTKAEERHRKLEERLDTLAKIMENLPEEKRAWQAATYLLFSAMICIFLVYTFKRFPRSSQTGAAATSFKVQRRGSVDLVTVATKKKKRRPSDQALKIVARSVSGDREKPPKKRKKKISNPIDTYNNTTFDPPCTSSKANLKPDWVEGRSRIIDDIPFPLEENDSYILDKIPLTPEIEPPKFMKTATTVRHKRSISLGNGNVEVKEKSSPVPSLNGSVCTEPTPKKEKKGFKKLFKKVF